MISRRAFTIGAGAALSSAIGLQKNVAAAVSQQNV